jgi:4,5:9,10-diseco-3-hydroxy-5,9,17-trioxoandrosta-1(10),2-diene-4-oate hydrolase
LHLFWATTGSSWPATTEESLSRGLLNADFAFTPRVLYPLAAVLLAATLMVLTRSGLFPWLGARVPGWLPTLVTIGLGAAVLIRAIAGIVWIAGIDSSTATWFYRLNLFLYTPACLAMFAGSVAVLRSPRDQDASDARVARRAASHAAR